MTRRFHLAKARTVVAYTHEVTALSSTANANTELRYTGRLVGPVGPPISVRVIVGGFADGSGVQSTSSAFFTLQAIDNLFGNASHSFGQARDTFSIDTIVKINPNVDFLVAMQALASAGNSFELHELTFSQAFVDPQFIVVDPGLAAIYHFEGIPQLTAVPLPPTGILLLFGLASLARRKRAQLG